MKNFEYDEFQKQAMAFIDKDESVIVSAPTGAGKTVIAEYVIEKCVREGRNAIYTSPIKALSNQKYRDFCALYGEDKVGIVTGDVSINSSAEIVLMTTEIFRNSLFEGRGRFKDRSWIIFDEIHYIDDIERGTVWEESLMFFPDNMHMLCLSATIPNIDEVVSWLNDVHHININKVVEDKRPVPLMHHFYSNKKVFENLQSLKHYYNNTSLNRNDFFENRDDDIFNLLKYIRSHDNLPCIYFVFARKRCEHLANHVSHMEFLTKEEKEQIKQEWANLINKFNLENDAFVSFLTPLIEKGIAFHHAGMLPTLKEVVERLFSTKLIKLIFATETFALGINMPAKSVVFDELRKYYAYKFDTMKTRDYFQMAGRAGRRGIDTEGYVYSNINPFRISYKEMERLVCGIPEDVKSQFSASYATLLNLYNEYGNDLFEIYLSSFHYFQSSKNLQHLARRQLTEKVALLHD
ncbi:DEAD/DEAH box helicase, partial [bacterium]|nr:DEAD/DEAH box helicase [bacterium]